MSGERLNYFFVTAINPDKNVRRTIKIDLETQFFQKNWVSRLE
jgi:hypothetical protein